MKTIFMVIFLVSIGLNVQSQELKALKLTEEDNNEINQVEKKVTIVPKNSIVLVSTKQGINTYEIVNEQIKNELFYNAEKRDALTALPGFIELGLSTDSEPMRVRIDSDYSEEYLKRYFTKIKQITIN